MSAFLDLFCRRHLEPFVSGLAALTPITVVFIIVYNLSVHEKH